MLRNLTLSKVILRLVQLIQLGYSFTVQVLFEGSVSQIFDLCLTFHFMSNENHRFFDW